MLDHLKYEEMVSIVSEGDLPTIDFTFFSLVLIVMHIFSG